MRFLHEMQETAQRQLDGMTVNRDVMANDVKQLIATFNQVICIAEDSTITEREAVRKILAATTRIKGVRG